MSIHAQLTPEALAKLRRQQRNSTITSVIISLLFLTLIALLLLFWLLPRIENITPDIVSYQSGSDEKEKHEKKQISRSIQRKPAAPSSSMAKVIAASTTSAIAVPVPERDTPITSLDLGSGDDFGTGWGDSDGWGNGSGTTFFGTKLSGEHILYIIDYSASMKGLKAKLMRKELADSVYRLPHDKKFQMIFFAGPAWIAGNPVAMAKNNKSAKISTNDGKKYHWGGKGSAYDWKPKGELQTPQWLDASDKQVDASRKIVRSTRLVWGTVWRNPLEMAFRMDPLPNVIIFMTDGSAGSSSMKTAEEYSRLARRRGVTINTISLMEPKAAKAMKKLAEGSGGTFSLINEKGTKINR